MERAFATAAATSRRLSFFLKCNFKFNESFLRVANLKWANHFFEVENRSSRFKFEVSMSVENGCDLKWANHFFEVENRSNHFKFEVSMSVENGCDLKWANHFF